MKPLAILAFALIALGIVALAYQGITYKTTENVLDLGPLQVTAERTHTIPLAPVLGVLALASGVVLFFISRRGTPRT